MINKTDEKIAQINVEFSCFLYFSSISLTRWRYDIGCSSAETYGDPNLSAKLIFFYLEKRY